MPAYSVSGDPVLWTYFVNRSVMFCGRKIDAMAADIGAHLAGTGMIRVVLKYEQMHNRG